jgi:hypothetical protein
MQPRIFLQNTVPCVMAMVTDLNARDADTQQVHMIPIISETVKMVEWYR